MSIQYNNIHQDAGVFHPLKATLLKKEIDRLISTHNIMGRLANLYQKAYSLCKEM